MAIDSSSPSSRPTQFENKAFSFPSRTPQVPKIKAPTRSNGGIPAIDIFPSDRPLKTDCRTNADATDDKRITVTWEGQ